MRSAATTTGRCGPAPDGRDAAGPVPTARHRPLHAGRRAATGGAARRATRVAVRGCWDASDEAPSPAAAGASDRSVRRHGAVVDTGQGAYRPARCRAPGPRDASTTREPRDQRCQQPARPRRPQQHTPPATDAALLERVLFEVKRVIVGQDRLVERMLVGLLARGHVLLEGVPGVAKTLAVETLAHRGRRLASPACSSPPTWCRPTSSAPASTRPARTPSTSSSARCSPTSCSPTRSTARRPRCSRRCSR